MKTKELIEQYNSVAQGMGMKKMLDWKGSKVALVTKIDSLVETAAVALTLANEGKLKSLERADLKSVPGLLEIESELEPKAQAKAPRVTSAATIRLTAETAIAAGKSNEEVLAVVQKAFPEAKTTLGCVRWYRSKLVTDAPAAASAAAGKKAS